MPNQIDASRRSLLRGRLETPTQLLPPWAVEASLFYDMCTRCGDCASACPENIIVSGSGGFPTVDFKQGECTFCQQCSTACSTQALQYQADQAPWHQRATISEKCLTLDKVICRSCGEACETEAIRFQIQAHGIAHPSIQDPDCTGCGACIAICPSQAIQIETYSPNESGVNLDENPIAMC